MVNVWSDGFRGCQQGFEIAITVFTVTNKSDKTNEISTAQRIFTSTKTLLYLYL